MPFRALFRYRCLLVKTRLVAEVLRVGLDGGQHGAPWPRASTVINVRLRSETNKNLG